jgi:hypothetical protein
MSTHINDSVVASQATRRSDRSGAPRTRLRGRKLILARVIWIAAVTLIVALFLAMLPTYYTALQTVCIGGMATCGGFQPTPDSAQFLQRFGISVGTYATFTFALYLALAFVCFSLGAVIFWRRSDDWMALLVALAVVATVTFNENNGYGMNSPWTEFTNVFFVLGTGLYVLVLSLSLDGRFVPRWTRWLLLCWFGASLVFIIYPSMVYSFVFYVELVLLMIAAIYRYRHASSPLQRQQGKWLLFGGCVQLIVVVGLTVLPFLFPSLGQAGSFYQLVLGPAFTVILLIFPLCLGFAILRFGFLDIDLIIHRTLLYGTLTVVLAVIYEVSVFTLQSLTSGLTFIRGNQLAIVASTFLIGGLFKPLYDRTKALIDRRFYRGKYDAARTVAAFSATIRDEVDLDQLGSKLIAVVQETMQPSHVSLWLCPPKRYGEKTTRALPIIETESEP